MKHQLMGWFVILFIWSCKQNSDAKHPKAIETKVETQVPKALKEIARFAELNFNDSTTVEDFFIFKEINLDGDITEVKMARAVELFEKLKMQGQSKSFPIFEIKTTNIVILPIQGTGFGGVIWAKVLVDRNTLEIKKIAFGHEGESEGYGDAIIQSTFEEQFVNIKIDLETDTFILQREIEKLSHDRHAIEGISGATVTSQGVVDMVNEGLLKHKRYLSR